MVEKSKEAQNSNQRAMVFSGDVLCAVKRGGV